MSSRSPLMFLSVNGTSQMLGRSALRRCIWWRLVPACLLCGSMHEHLDEVSAVLRAAVRVARGVGSLVGDRPGILARGPGGFCCPRAQWCRTHADECNRGLSDITIRATGNSGDADGRPVLRAPAELDVAPAVVAGQLRNPHL